MEPTTLEEIHSDIMTGNATPDSDTLLKLVAYLRALEYRVRQLEKAATKGENNAE